MVRKIDPPMRPYKGLIVLHKADATSEGNPGLVTRVGTQNRLGMLVFDGYTLTGHPIDGVPYIGHVGHVREDDIVETGVWDYNEGDLERLSKSHT